MDVKLTNVFRRNAEALINAINGTGPRLIINEGGQGSSKTYSILQVIYNALSSGPKMKTTFCSYALPHLKQGVISDFDNILTSFGEEINEIKSQPSQPVYHIGKSEINCYGVEGNIAMAHGPRRKILYINECNRKITYDVFDQLFSRSEITFIDYNPDQSFWMHEKVMPNIPHVIIRSNLTDNPYIPKNELDNILMKRDKPEFANWWKVYGLGMLGKLEGAIYTNWEYGLFDDSLPYSYGEDFGFNPDPDTLIKVAIDRKKKIIYAKECFYTNFQGTERLIENVWRFVTKNELIIADSSSNRIISDLRQSGLNVLPCVKYSGSVLDGIKLINNYKIVITEDSHNLAKELNNYIWNDRRAGIPIDAWNHLLDALSYNVRFVLQQIAGVKSYN